MKMLIVFATIIALSAAAPDNGAKYSTLTSVFQDRKKSDLPCETPECIHAASTLLKNMDQSVDPCDDFYQFACGKFPQEETFEPLSPVAEENVRKIVDDSIKEHDQPFLKLAKSFYNICVNSEHFDRIGEEDLREILKNLGGWPVLEGPSWNETNYDWKESVHKINKMGFYYDVFISVDVVTDNYNSSGYILRIKQGNRLLNNSKQIFDVAVRLGAARNQTEKEFSDVSNFELELAKISTARERDDDYHLSGELMTLQQLETNFSGIPWSEFINGLIAPYAHVGPNEKIIVESLGYFEALVKLLESTPKRTVANYVPWNLVELLSEYLTPNDNNNINKCNGSEFNKEVQRKKCLYETSRKFRLAVSSVYVKRFFDESTKNNVFNMMKNIKITLHQMIYQADWMDDETKSQALEKLNSIKQYVGYPDDLVSDEKLNEYYKNLQLYSESYFKSRLSVNRHIREKEFSTLRQSVQETIWEKLCKDLIAVNSLYYQENVMIIQAGMLQRRYNSERPNYMNYGAVGSVIGHEMSHAFGPQARLFDKDGNLRDWWKDETREKYLEKAKCMIEQYGKYTVEDVDVALNGTACLKENMADNVGLKAAYYAYNQLINDYNSELRLPGLQYTPQQLFWISEANSRCGKMTIYDLALIMRFYVHSPNKFRVNGPRSNIPEFSKDFQCPLGSPMNPVKKCLFW